MLSDSVYSDLQIRPIPQAKTDFGMSQEYWYPDFTQVPQSRTSQFNSMEKSSLSLSLSGGSSLFPISKIRT